MRLIIPQTGKHRLPVFFIMLLIVLVVATACNDNAANEVTVKSMNVPEAKAYSPVADYLPAFYLDRTAFLATVDSVINYKDKLVLKYELKAKKIDSSLAVFRIADWEKKEDKFNKVNGGKTVRYPKPFANALKLSGKAVKLVHQRTKEDEYQKLLLDVKKYKFINYIIFVPEIEDDHVRFKITGVEKLPLDMMATGFATTTYYSRSF